MWRDYYVAEKLREMEAARRRGSAAPPPPSSEPRPRLRPLVRLTGRTLRRLGEGLESWAVAAHPERHGEQRRYQGR